jgi:hypothetical protein
LNFDRSEAGSSVADLLSVDSGVTNEESSAGSTPVAGTQKRFQKKMSNDQVRIVLEAFYDEARSIDSKVSINKFADCRLIPRGTFSKVSSISVGLESSLPLEDTATLLKYWNDYDRW